MAKKKTKPPQNRKKHFGGGNKKTPKKNLKKPTGIGFLPRSEAPPKTPLALLRKIQGTYFKISALYFKIYALCFFAHALCDFSCLFSSLENRLSIRKNGFAPDTCSFLFCHFLKADRRKRGTEQVSTLQEKLFVPETPRNGTC